jgi:hypothetical protein
MSTRAHEAALQLAEVLQNLMQLINNVVHALESQAPSRLEMLPPELRHLILLAIPDLTTLRALVHASPVMHAQYLERRSCLLSICLMRDMSSEIDRAYYTTMARLGTHSDEYMTVVQSPSGRLALRPRWDPSAALEEINPAHVQMMASFHLTVIQPLLEERYRRIRDQDMTDQQREQCLRVARGNLYVTKWSKALFEPPKAGPEL